MVLARIMVGILVCVLHLFATASLRANREPSASSYPLDSITHLHDPSVSPRRVTCGLYDTESNGEDWHAAPGQTLVLADLDGPGEIRHMWFVICGPFCDDRRWPRNVVLRIYWDHSTVPSVETPIGDFFAAGNGMLAPVHSSLPIETTSYGRAMNSYWRMPFREHATITISNEGPSLVGVFFQIDWLRGVVPATPQLYFHARYRQEYPAQPFEYYHFVNITGRGNFVGLVLSSVNQLDSWFGEVGPHYISSTAGALACRFFIY